jgi:outer membrane protein OmpA-like peptidoglycan-associated protein
MKHHLFWIVLVGVALMTPAIAQQTNEAQNQPTASTGQGSTSQTGQSADQGLSARQPLTPERHEGFWGKLNPMARKKYVQRQMQPIRDRVNELDELTATNAKNIKDVDARAQEGIRLASAKASEADQHAIEAGNRAQMANQTAQQASTRLNTVEQVVGNIDQYQPATQAEIHFRPGQAVLSKKAKVALDEIADSVKNQKGYIIEVQGFSAGHGQAAVANSKNMADSVVRYLVLNHDIPVYRIYVLGLGNAPVPASASGGRAKRTTGGRVEVSLLKNGVDQLTASAAPPSSAAQGGVSGTTAAPSPASPKAGNANANPASNMNAPAAPASSQPAQEQQPAPQQ